MGSDPNDVATWFTTDGAPPPPPAPTLSPDAAAPSDDEPPPLPGRYVRLDLLGRGGMGEVWRVRDKVLDRTLALKLIQARHAPSPQAVARFRAEAQLTARLQHPGIVPVHDLGITPDGRWWYTMEEVRGRRIGHLLVEMSEAGATLHRAIDLLHRACQAVAYAHSLGVVHRDLKPDNILVGALGEVRVVDWGVAKVLGAADEGGAAVESGPGHTSAGAVIGTPRFMAPEQARGDNAHVGPAADVYGLGVILDAVLERWPAPAELRELADRATREAPEERPVDAGELAAELGAWLEGARQRERALAAVAAAVAGAAEIPRLREEAARLRRQAEEARKGVPSWAPIAEKRPLWALQDRAAALEVEAARREVETVQALQGAFVLSPDLPEAHAALADWYRDRHAEAERARDTTAAAAHEQRLRHHDRAGRHAAWLRGDGRLTLLTDPPATAELHRYELRDRRLVPVFVRRLETPIVDEPLAMGSWLLVLRAPGGPPVHYPVAIGRGEHWDGTPPGGTAPEIVSLPPSLPADEVFVPQGPSWIGGDPEANNPLPWRRLWFEPLVARRFPVTNREYLAFLNALVAEGDETLALRCAPRERAARVDDDGALLYGRRPDGTFFLQADADGDTWDPDWPAIHVDWWGAHAYAAWLARTTGQPWRLPGDLELERLSRGVDARVYPWGPHLDPTWCHMIESHRERPLPDLVHGHPTDVSAWGVRGVGGNVRVWSLDVFAADGPAAEDGRAPPPVDPGDDPAYRVTRGGDWYGPDRLCRCANRGRDWPQVRVSILGFRVVRDVSGADGRYVAPPQEPP